MFKKTMTAMGIALIAATPALALEGPFPIKDIDADTNFQAMENPNALDHYPDLANDIENAIRARADLADEDDYRPLNLDIQVTALRLNDNPVLTDDGEFNILEGIVNVYDEANPQPIRTEPIILEAMEAEVPYPAFSPDNDDFYKAMVYAFADRAVSIAGEITELPDEAEIRN
ncbi:hypothetical protein SAMN05421762_2228 [Pseudooceanicola nitratireducens]|jgi:hypothetical protein|uniref:Uncharacterized protein n=1 Tax=Pseudooceanicola nitratireducens TaxID=517719 RepID=A0A1I1M861_9RHOB|nr:hypothetical protein [Pseudooceanicola nitratireducens]SEI92038.1 hypothetical protein SAMN05216183_1011112 [Pseudooceanicola nitratireducens]SFC79408.1 hypothetical protein SAMN05421762_2228 [Pseudooceanicola nitratireducens]